MKYYFFKTVKVDNRPRLRALPNQTMETGEAIDTELNVQADSIMRGSYPIGTVFVSDMIGLRTSTSTDKNFYSAGAIYPLLQRLGEYIVQSHIPSDEAKNAYEAYQSQNTNTIVIQTAQETPAKEAGTPTLIKQLAGDKALACPDIPTNGFYCDKSDWLLIMRNIRKRINTMFIGASGTGKTELAMLACKRLGVECSVYDMGSMHDPLAQLLGVHRLEKGSSVFDYAKFTQDIQKPGVVILDEFSRAPLGTANILIPCLDSRRCLPVEMAGGENVRNVHVHPDCVFIATANIGAEFTGTMNMDRALKDRFFIMEFDYLPREQEIMLLCHRHKLSAGDAANIVSVAQSVRDLYNKQELSTTISTRWTLSAAAMVEDGFDALTAMEKVYLPLFEGTKTEGERSIVSKIFMTR